MHCRCSTPLPGRYLASRLYVNVNVRALVLRDFVMNRTRKRTHGIIQLCLPPTRFIPARAEQGLEHFIRNELVNVASHFTDLGRMEA